MIQDARVDGHVALCTDGRLAGTVVGLAVGHVSRGALEGGPLALVHDSYPIVMDISNRRLYLSVSDHELLSRQKDYEAPHRTVPRGFLELYVKAVTPAHEGAVLSSKAP